MFTLPILAYLYHRDGCASARLWSLPHGATSAASAASRCTRCPRRRGSRRSHLRRRPQLQPDELHERYREGRPESGVPAGLQRSVLHAGLYRRAAFAPALPSVGAAGLAASLLIEVSQLTGLFGIYPYAYRCCDVDDVITNTLGAALGWVCAWLLGRVVPPGQLADGE